MKQIKLSVVTFITLLTFSTFSWALSLNDAKAQGLIGERSNGYLGIVVGNPQTAVKRLVEDINRKRRTAYQDKARKAGVDLQVIELRVGQRLRERALSGQFVQDSHGQWERK